VVLVLLFVHRDVLLARVAEDACRRVQVQRFAVRFGPSGRHLQNKKK